MLRISLLLSLAVAFSTMDGIFASPSCSHGMSESDKCITKCRTKFGWPGFAMGTDAWGAVAKPYAGDVDGMVSKACGSSSGNSSSTNVAGGSAQGPAIAAPLPQSNIPAPPYPESSPSSAPTSTSSNASITSPAASSTHTPAAVTSSAIHIAGAVEKGPESEKPASSSPPPPKPTSTPPPPPPPSPSPKPASPPETSHAPAPVSAPAPDPAPQSSPKSNSGSSGSSGSSSSSAPSNSGSSDSSSSGSTSSSDISQYLSAHNSIRVQHGASPLSWSDSLAGTAQQWANNCVFQHSGGKLGPFGENLAAGTGSSYGIAEAIKSWTDEVSEYNANSPVPSHFTQVVWKGTSQVGCAVKSCDGIFSSDFGKAKFFVCEYSAQGNVIGEFDQNVQA